ncbi:hypothetical protein MN116_005628 [Schistosoma mekongi]|uniref:Magnesium transporter NIPA2 n=1 Tax=Schistosoma mekongi TaxID=38744 RepID=A0AAE1ZAM1_SCHME|nr:hypothetical protein MN116_005628 [Schistosoma mekongi]
MSNNSDSVPSLIAQKSFTDFYIGLGLALLSTIFIGTSFIFKKLALRRISRNGLRAGDGSLSYLCEWMWWMGFFLMAYTFAPAMLVTPLGGLSVLVSALLSVHFLNEHLNCIGGFGCVICLLGSTLIIIHAPKEQNLTSLQEMWLKVTDTPFIIYSLFIILMSIVLICILGPRYGKTNPIIFTLISGSIGSLSVIACKGIGIGLKNAFTMNNTSLISFWFFWFLFIWLITSITIQIYALFDNYKSDDYFQPPDIKTADLKPNTINFDINFSWYNLCKIFFHRNYLSLIMHNKQSNHIDDLYKSTIKIHYNKHLSLNKVMINDDDNDYYDSDITDTVQLL